MNQLIGGREAPVLSEAFSPKYALTANEALTPTEALTPIEALSWSAALILSEAVTFKCEDQIQWCFRLHSTLIHDATGADDVAKSCQFAVAC